MYFSISTGELKEHPDFRDIFFNMYLPRYSNKKEKTGESAYSIAM